MHHESRPHRAQELKGRSEFICVYVFELLANNQSSHLFGLNVQQECNNGEVDCAACTRTRFFS